MERRLGYRDGECATARFDVENRTQAGIGGIILNITKTDTLSEDGGLGPGCYLSYDLARLVLNGITTARDAALVDREADQLALGACCFHGCQVIPTHEIGSIQLGHPSETRFERVGLGSDVVSVEAIARFEAQGVARSQTGWFQVKRGA